MQHHHDGAAALAVEPGDQVEHLDLVGEVEVRRRLVEQQQVGVLGQGHRDPGALPLTAGELVERPVAQVGGVGHRQRRLDDLLVLGRPLAEPALVRVPAAADQVADQQALGRDGLWGSSASRARRRGSASWIGSPSSSTWPTVRLEQPGQVRSRVDLPQPFGPMIVVTWPSGMVEVRSRTTGSSPYPTVTALGAQACGVGRIAHAVTFRLVRSRSQIRYGAPIGGRDQAGGQRERDHHPGDQVGADDQAGAEDHRGQHRRARAAGEPQRDLRDDERDELERPDGGDRDRGQADRGEQRSSWVDWSRTPRPRAESSPSCSALSVRTSEQARPAPARPGSTAAGIACSQPRPLSEPLSQTWALAASWIRALTSSHDDERGEHGAEADADQHQPLAVDAAAPGEQVEQRGGGERRRRTRRAAAPTACSGRSTRPPPYPEAPASTITATAPTAAPSVTPRMSGLASGLRAKVWVSAPDRPSAAPTRTATRVCGSRSSWTMNSLGRVAAAEQGRAPRRRAGSRSRRARGRARPGRRARRRRPPPSGPTRRRAAGPARTRSDRARDAGVGLGGGAHIAHHPGAADQEDEDRAADQRHHDADLQLAGSHDHPAEHVGEEQQQRADQARRTGPSSGSRRRRSSRATWGTTSPTKAIGPQAAVAAPASSITRERRRSPCGASGACRASGRRRRRAGAG